MQLQSALLTLAIGLVTCTAAIAETPARWTQSFDAGYVDQHGAYAGGSEIMHLVSHKKKLYAANGYWVDSHWEIPPDTEKQSAQVLRLDAADESWNVDLDLGKSNGLNLRYMKGNILKSVTFTRDKTGKSLTAPQNLLVMAAGANFDRGGAVSAWVRNDSNGTWSHSLVRHGSNAGGVRWAPRDMQVYTDKVTGIERLYLLLGNPGIISGVYDSMLPTKIRWSTHVEFPFLEKGSFRTRPLGIVEANGALLFSVGGSIFQRVDGLEPSYTEILKLREETDTDVGGIRGLTTITNPNGNGQSILFVWAPGGRSKCQVKRLDPDGSGGYTVHNEKSLLNLMSQALGVRVTNPLGAHNMMYPMVDQATGETVHLIGFQGNIWGKDQLRWKGSRLYAGAMYAVRRSDQTYKVLEVNNAYAPGKPVLVAPRTFCVSPFNDNRLFVGGHDSNSHISDDMAWIFRAPLDVALGATPGLDAKPSKQVSSPASRLLAGPVYELRIYVANEGRFQHLVKRFKEHTDRLFKKHGMMPVGYWTPLEGPPIKKRTFVYVLKHPSRYEAWKNWKSFIADHEWQAVLDRPEFQRLLRSKPESVFMTANDYSTVAKEATRKPDGIFELRTYVANTGKLASLNARFRDHTTQVFNRHGIKSFAYWTPFDRPDSKNSLICLLHHSSRDQADANWKAYNKDSQNRQVIKKSEANGPLLKKPPSTVYLRAMDFSR